MQSGVGLFGREVVAVERVQVVAVPPVGPLPEQPAVGGHGAVDVGERAGGHPGEGADERRRRRRSGRQGVRARDPERLLGGRGRPAQAVEDARCGDRRPEDKHAVGVRGVAAIDPGAGAEGVIRPRARAVGGRAAVARAEEGGNAGRDYRRVGRVVRPEERQVARRLVGDRMVEVQRVGEAGLFDEREHLRQDRPAILLRGGRRGNGPGRDEEADRERVPRRVIVMQPEPDLLEVVHALRPPRGLAGGLHGGQQKRDQDRDDRDHDQELDQGEGPATSHCPAELCACEPAV